MEMSNTIRFVHLLDMVGWLVLRDFNIYFPTLALSATNMPAVNIDTHLIFVHKTKP